MYAVEEMRNLVNLIKLSPPDLMVVSMEGMKFPTWRLLLAMHSPLLAKLLIQILRPGDDGLLAVTLPLPYSSVSSMLASLSEGGNLDHLGEAGQLLGGNSKITTKEGNPKMFQGLMKIQEGGNLDQLGEAAQVLAFGNNELLTCSGPSQVLSRERNPTNFEEEIKGKSSLANVVEVDQQLHGINNMLSSASYAPTKKVSRNGRNSGTFQQMREIEKGRGNINQLGDAPQLLGNDMLSNAFGAAKDSGTNARNFQRVTEIQEGGNLVIVGKATQLSSSKNKSILPDVRNPSVLPKAHSTNNDSDQYLQISSKSVQNLALEISPKGGKVEIGEYIDNDNATGTVYGNEVFDIKSEGETFREITTPEENNSSDAGNDLEENVEDIFIDIIDMNTNMYSRQSQGGFDPARIPPGLDKSESETFGEITPGLLFPDYNSMTDFLDKWSRNNFSPLTKRSSGGINPNQNYHVFCCPHKKTTRSPTGSGIRTQRKNIVEYVDCPFRIILKVNLDGSCVVTRALTEHRGHEVSEEQFQKYQR